MNEDLKKNLLNIEVFQRFAFMVLFVLIFLIVKLVVFAIAIFQLVHLLFTGTLHNELKTFAHAVSIYVFDITKFLTFDSEEQPFPFKPWPTEDKEMKTQEKEPEEKEKKITKKITKKVSPDDEDEIHA